MRYGIGITTRNRPEVLAVALQEHSKYAPTDCKFVIVDDNSNEDNSKAVSKFSKKHNVEYRYSNTRLGIAKAKNACLAKLTECDHVFLLDDDVWPKFNGWADSWAWASDYSGVGHSMYITDLSVSSKAEKQKASASVISKLQTLEYFSSWNNCFGIALYFNRACLNTIGGYDHLNAVNVYGYEHAQISKRAKMAGFTKGFDYLAPNNCKDLIYSLDIDYNWFGELPNAKVPWITSLRSSTTPEEAARHVDNAKIMNVSSYLIPLVDPLG